MPLCESALFTCEQHVKGRLPRFDCVLSPRVVHSKGSSRLIKSDWMEPEILQ